VAVIDFQHVDGEAGGVESASLLVVWIAAWVPASFFSPFGHLGFRQDIPHHVIPGEPLAASHVMEDLGGVVPVVAVGPIFADEVFQQLLGASLESWIFALPAEVLAAEESFGGH
jgi:hypothetical protein